jgi:hypothetical protein
MRGISWLAEGMLATQEELCSIELVAMYTLHALDIGLNECIYV